MSSSPFHFRKRLRARHHAATPPLVASEPTGWSVAGQRRRGGGDPERALAYARQARRRFLGELAELIRFPTVSAQPRHAGDMARCATWLADHLQGIGMEHVQVSPHRHPIVTADWLHLPWGITLLVYGHYDVQPPDPLAAWRSPPFEPVIRGEYLYGRGASDDKGQMFAHVKALESYLRASGGLPVNVCCVFEGEEEVGSVSLPAFLSRHLERRVHAAVVSDMWTVGRGRPAIAESLRGAVSIELEVRGQAHDLHSGNFGGAVHNPLQALCQIIASLHDVHGAIAIPGFYDRVRDLTPVERAYMARVGPPDARILHDAHAPCGWGEPGFSLYERTTARPALSVNGIVGGYQGPGAKAVIPARALAKLNFRLVPDQDPDEVDASFRQHVTRIAPCTVRVGVRTLFRAHPFVQMRDHRAMRAAAEACHRGFGAPPVFLRIGGTIPVAHLLQTELGIPTVLMGFALPDDGMHGPNERFYLPHFFRGIETSVHLMALLAEPTPVAWRRGARP